MKKIIGFVLTVAIMLALVPQIVMASSQPMTPQEAINAIARETSKTWNKNYYDWLEYNPETNSIKRDGSVVDVTDLNAICGFDADTVEDFLSQAQTNELYEVYQREGKWIIKNPYQTHRIYLASDFDIELPETDKITKTIWYDTKHVIVVCGTQQDTHDVYQMLQTREGRKIRTMCLDRIVSAQSMHSTTDGTEVEEQESKYCSYGFDLLNIDVLKEKAVNDVTVGIIDSGVTREHTFFIGRNIKDGISFIKGGRVSDDQYGHGTHVTSTIVEGTNEHTSILPIQVFDAEGKTSMIIIDAAIRYATAQKVDCVNMSLGIPQIYIGQYNYLEDSLKEMYDAKIVFVKSAGNHSSVVQYDAPCGDYVISVAAVDKNGKLAGFSNYGDQVDFACYGVNVVGALNNLKLGTKSGTSMAAPHITACVALLKSEDITRSVDDIYRILKENSTSINSNGLIEGNVLPRF